MHRLEQGNHLPGGGMRPGGGSSSSSSGYQQRSPSSSSYQPAATAAAPVRPMPLAAAITVEFKLHTLLPTPTLALAHSYSARLVDLYKAKIPADRYR